MSHWQVCHFYGSARGCYHGNECRYSHNEPNSIPLCQHRFNCKYGNNCRFRHKIYRNNNNNNYDGRGRYHRNHQRYQSDRRGRYNSSDYYYNNKNNYYNNRHRHHRYNNDRYYNNDSNYNDYSNENNINETDVIYARDNESASADVAVQIIEQVSWTESNQNNDNNESNIFLAELTELGLLVDVLRSLMNDDNIRDITEINNQIEMLPIQKYEINAKNIVTKCCICLENFKDKEELKRLPCMHLFHKNEIDKWLKTNVCCPICRLTIFPKNNSE